MKAKTSALASAMLLGAALACVVAYNSIGSHVDEQGVLREPFALIPIGYLLLATGVALGLYSLGRLLWNRRQTPR